MATFRLDPNQSVLLVIDMQTKFLAAIHEADRVRRRVQLIAGCAKDLRIPVIATEQVPDRMGGTEIALAEYVGEPIAKRAFSAWGEPQFRERFERLGRTQAVVVGIETHICVAQTAIDLHLEGVAAVVCPDAVSAGDNERHKLGMERVRDAGVTPCHAEGVIYEWLGTAEHPEFRSVLARIKADRT